MIKLRFLILIAIILQLPFYSSGQFTRQKAIDLVLNQILASDTGYINVYSSYDTIPDTSNIILLNGQTISPPYPYNWVFFSDDNPVANWNHTCRYIFINSNTGDFTIDSSSCYPIDIQTNYHGILIVYQCPPPVCNTNVFNSGPSPTPTIASPNPHLHAVLINGVDGGNYTCDINRDYDIAMVYNALKEVGYDTANIITLYSNGTDTAGRSSFRNDWDGTNCDPPNGCNKNEVKGPAYWSAIYDTLTKFAYGPKALTPEDQLFVYITGPGGKDCSYCDAYFQCYSTGQSPNEFTTTYLKQAVHNINCAQMIFVMQQNYSGCFVYPLTHDTTAKCQNRIVQAATGDGSPSYPSTNSYKELWFTCGNIDEFTFYWTAAIRGHYEGRWPWDWSYPVGQLPFNNLPWTDPSRGWHPTPHPLDYNPDSGTPGFGNVDPGNNDGFTQLTEAFRYAKAMDTWCQDGYWNQSKLAQNSNGDFETPEMGVISGFSVDTLFCLNGIAGNTSASSQEVKGYVSSTYSYSYLLGGRLNVWAPMTIDQSAQLTLGANSFIYVVANNQLTVNSPGVIFNGDNGFEVNGLVVEDNSYPLNLEQATFNNCYLADYCSNLTIDHSTFTNCNPVALDFHWSNINPKIRITNSAFNKSALFLSNNNPSDTVTANIINCTFNQHPLPINSITVEDFHNYNIINNIISYGLEGISLFYCGNDIGNHLVQGNQISNCTSAGIVTSASTANLTANDIEGNQVGQFGIKLLNWVSSTTSVGNQNATSPSETQNINNCTRYEIYATDHCFPTLLKYNVIMNSNSKDTFVYYGDNYYSKPPSLNVYCNYWGLNVNPGSRLYANYGNYIYTPIWNFPGSCGGLPDDEAMYDNAMNDVNNGDYSDAKNLFQLLVETYPTSHYAQSSMKELYSIEPYAGNDFASLQLYYLTNDSIMADSTLQDLGGYLANNCSIQLQNWADAMDYYINGIEDPESETDSIFATIDLGHLYFLMDSTNQKSTYAGLISQLVPKTRKSYVKLRDSLIRLLPLPKHTLKKSNNKLQSGQLLKNVPNPTNLTTDIYFKLYSVIDASIKIYDYLGRLQQEIPITDLKDGVQKITCNTSLMPAGVYVYSLVMKDKTTDTKKMVVIR